MNIHLIKKILATTGIMSLTAIGAFAGTTTTTIEIAGSRNPGTSTTVTHHPDGSTTVSASCIGTSGVCASATIKTDDNRLEKGDATTIRTYDQNGEQDGEYSGLWDYYGTTTNPDGSVNANFTLYNFH